MNHITNIFTIFFFILTLFTLTPNTTNAQSFTTNDFITTWDTENTGTSANNQITIPGTGAGYSYSIYWESLSSSTATGTIATSTSASQTITFPEPGEYKVAIKGTYPRLFFFNNGDKLKILTVEQWGSNLWTSMAGAFYGCANLTVPATDAPDLSGVTGTTPSISSMFRGATSFNQSINHWVITSNIRDLGSMFRDATSFNQPLDNWNISHITNFSYMFDGATSFNQDITGWDTSNVTTMRSMFSNATAFDQDLSTWDVSSATPSSTPVFMNGLENMFFNAGLSQSNLDSTLTAWSGQSLNQNVPFHLGLKTYSQTGQSALNVLRNTYNWTITEQYQATYEEGNGYTLSGTTTQTHVSHGSTTTPVEVIPDDNCVFEGWSDDITTNPRTDTLTDNLTVTPIVTCHTNSSGSSAKTRHQKLLEYGNTAEAEAVKDKCLNPTNSNTSSLETAITTITTLATNPVITNNPQTRQQLISILQQLVQILEVVRG
ncbi:MAG: hypothetical protein UZ19_OD1000420 [Parcubacteria bacterium OLB19]|nr:MAG: hypothetical protein UZ19_OD1000420 [Parcubacteria bacterium OLB19]